MILRTTPSYIRLEVDGRTVKVEGEAAGMGPGQRPYFVAYSNSIYLEPPHEDDELDDKSRKRILEVLKEDCRVRNFPLEIE